MKTNKKGFTLVEIMIVVAIIGLLAAIGIPSFQKARSNSINQSMENNTRIVNAGIAQCAMNLGLTDGTIVQASDYMPYIKGETTDLDVGALAFQSPSAFVGVPLASVHCYNP